MTAAAQTTAAPSHHYWLRIGLMTVAALELMDAVASLGHVSVGPGQADALMRTAQLLLTVKLALAPVAAGAALLFAALGWLRAAVLSLAAFALIGWGLDDVWTLVNYGLGFRPDSYYGPLDTLAHQVIFPLGALAGAVMALTTRHLAWAGLLASLPPLFNWVHVLLFAASILLSGV
jgi:hypothetical protein